jgi:hypothetical protein
MPDLVRDLSFEDRMGLVVDREIALQESLRTGRRLKAAKLRIVNSNQKVDHRGNEKVDHPRDKKSGCF